MREVKEDYSDLHFGKWLVSVYDFIHELQGITNKKVSAPDGVSS